MHRDNTTKIDDSIKGLRVVFAIRGKTPNHLIFFKEERNGRRQLDYFAPIIHQLVTNCSSKRALKGESIPHLTNCVRLFINYFIKLPKLYSQT